MKIKLLSILAVIALGIAVMATTFMGIAKKQEQYNGYIARARLNAEKEIPYNAYQNYRSAFAIQCEDESVYQEFLVQAELLGQDFYADAVKNYVVKFPESACGYELLCGLYYESGNYRTVLSTALEAREKGIATEKVRDWYLECFHMLRTVKSGFDDAQSFLGSYARVEIDGLYGYINAEGNYLLAPLYEQASHMMGTNAAVYDGEEWYMMNSAGFKVARTSTPVDYLSVLSSGKICVAKDGKYGYTTSSMNIPENLPYDYASTFKNGVAAVRQGDKWALIDSSEQPLTGFVFEDILLDEYNTCMSGGVIFVKYEGKYYMVNAEGAKISDRGFDDAYPFAGTQPAAVCIDGKWGFVDTSGNMVIEPQYSGARSFSIGLGAVCVDGQWGYINTNGEFRIACQFEDCKPFSANGIAAVKVNGTWKYVQLLAYQN